MRTFNTEQTNTHTHAHTHLCAHTHKNNSQGHQDLQWTDTSLHNHWQLQHKGVKFTNCTKFTKYTENSWPLYGQNHRLLAQYERSSRQSLYSLIFSLCWRAVHLSWDWEAEGEWQQQGSCLNERASGTKEELQFTDWVLQRFSCTPWPLLLGGDRSCVWAWPG